MIQDLKPYPAYKDSGVPWLGEVPEHWDVRRLKQVCSKSALYGANVAATSYMATGVRFLRTTDITEDGHLKRGGVFLPHESILDYLLMDGDLLISRSGTVGRTFLYQAHLHGPCAYAGYLVRFVPDTPVLSRYLFLFTKTQSFAGFLRVMAISSTIENVNGEKYANAPMPLPPLSEQTAIIRFLDHVDRRIRRYIRAKQKLISLLNEQKQAIIQRAVTRGLDSNVRLKPSGVEWLGDVPEHWEVVLNQRIFKEEIRPHRGLPETQLSLSQRDGLIATSAMQERSLQTSTYDNWKVTVPGDLVLNRFKAHLGVFFASTLRGIVSFHYGVFSPRHPLVTKYFELLYHTNIYRTIYAGRSNGMTVGLQNLSNQNFYNVRSIVPPVHEQMEIVSFAETATERLRNSIQTAEREIALLREYRTRLIADVVTGKLDVREAAARLPDEAEEPEPLDEADALVEDDDATEGADLDTAPEESET